MVKYILTAIGLKASSCSKVSKRAYRALGNSLGSKKRAVEKMPSYYVARVNNMLRLAKKFGVPKDGDKLLEIGTGWLHWEAITAKLFFNIHGTLFDVWDNRQILGLNNYLRQLDEMLDKLDADHKQRASAHKLISQIISNSEYDEIYKLLDLKYVLGSKEGGLKLLEKESFDIIVSAGVLEHIYREDAPEVCNSIADLLKPGGYSVHSINMRDHLYAYDKSASVKQYLRYPDWVWRLFFENDVQYINRIQRSDWLRLFQKAGLDVIEQEVECEDLGEVKVSQSYQEKYSDNDLKCCGLKILHRKPIKSI